MTAKRYPAFFSRSLLIDKAGKRKIVHADIRCRVETSFIMILPHYPKVLLENLKIVYQVVKTKNKKNEIKKYEIDERNCYNNEADIVIIIYRMNYLEAI